jgi:hypothetical protein
MLSLQLANAPAEKAHVANNQIDVNVVPESVACEMGSCFSKHKQETRPPFPDLNLASEPFPTYQVVPYPRLGPGKTQPTYDEPTPFLAPVSSTSNIKPPFVHHTAWQTSKSAISLQTIAPHGHDSTLPRGQGNTSTSNAGELLVISYDIGTTACE